MQACTRELRSLSPTVSPAGTGVSATGAGPPAGALRISTAAPLASAPIRPISPTSGLPLASQVAPPVSSARNAATPAAGTALGRDDMDTPSLLPEGGLATDALGEQEEPPVGDQGHPGLRWARPGHRVGPPPRRRLQRCPAQLVCLRRRQAEDEPGI